MDMNISNEKLHPRKVSTPKSFSDMSHSKIDGLSSSNASCLKIDSICIDLLRGNEKKEVENCKHFSIRGYVAEIRKRDKKLCWPFPLDSKHYNAEASSDCTLPPMAAPKFRWWRCQNCLREIGPQCTVETFSRNGQKSNNISACSHMSSHGEADKLALVLVNNNSDIIGAQTCAYNRESAGVEGTRKKRDNSDIIKGDLSSLINGVNHKFREHSSYMAKLDPCHKLEKNERRNTDAIESNCNGFVETCKPIFDDQAAGLMTVCGISEEKDNAEPVFATSDHENNFREYSSSDSDEIIGRQNRFAKHDDNSSTSRRTKPRRKVRLLSDILLALDGRASANNAKSCENPSTSSGQTKKRKPTRDFSDKDASLKRGSQAGNSDRGDKHVVDGISIPNKKLKKPCLDDQCPSLSPLQEVSYGGNEKRGQDPNKSNTSGSTYQSSAGKATESVLQSVFPAKESEKFSSLCKKNSKVLQLKIPQTFPMPFSVEPMQTGIMPAQQNYLPCLQPQRDFLLTGKEGIFREDQMSKKGFGCKYIGESSRPYKSSLDARTSNRVQWDLNFKTGDKVASIFSEKPSLSQSKERSESVRVKEGSKSVDKQHSVRNGDRVLEKEAIDDIPIEIIELLAKHPYEKRLKDAEKASNFSDSANKVNNGKGTDAKELHANGEVNFIEERNHGLLRSYSSNSNKNGFTKGESAGSMNQQAQSNEAQFPMNAIWPSMIQNHVSYGHQATGQDRLSRRPETVLNGKNKKYDLNFSNVNVGSYGKQNMKVRSSEVANKTLGEDPSTCNKRNNLERQMKGSASVYPNEVIPAMHLLSLMDSGSAPFNLDQQKTELIKRPPLPYNQHSKELSWPSHVSKHATSVDYGKKYPFPEKSCECLSAMPAFGVLTSSLQNDISVRRIADSHGQVPKKYTGKSKANPRLKSASQNVDSHTNGQLSHGHGNKKNGLVGAYTIVRPSQQHKKMDGSMTISELKSQCAHGNETIRPVKRKPKMEICIVNRNPADFTMPEAGNEYMISGDDLYLGRKRHHIDNSAITSINPPKKKRLVKRDSSNEHAQNQIPPSFTTTYSQQFFKALGSRNSESIFHTKSDV